MTTFEKYASKKEPERTSSNIQLEDRTSSMNAPLLNEPSVISEPLVEYKGVNPASLKNCFSMCFTNKRNLVYQIGS